MIEESVRYIKQSIKNKPTVALMLGSGLGSMADEIEESITIPYQSIPNFPISTAPGHEGALVIGKLCDKNVIAFKGRFHFYEGYSMRDLALPIRAVRLLGVDTLILTNAAGGINKSFEPGDLMIINDHIKFFDDSPLRGKNDDRFGPRFNDMGSVYTKKLRELAKAASNKPIHEGVYAFMPGPCYETPAEIRALRLLGADAVGMSTVPEATVAAHAGMNVLGISCICNMAAGILPQPLTEKEVLETAGRVKEEFSKLIKEIVGRI